jgi:hypothetical protein
MGLNEQAELWGVETAQLGDVDSVLELSNGDRARTE